MDIGDNKTVRGKFVNGIFDKPGGVGIPITVPALVFEPIPEGVGITADDY
jgi:hypothetical protein